MSAPVVCDPLYYAFINKMDGNDATNRMKTLKCTKYNKKTTLQNDLNNAHYNDTGNVLNLSGLLIFRTVAEPRNCGKSVKSREIHKNTKNTLEIR